ncbi:MULTISPECIES: ABC transporter ATP-binding protein [Micromonospora]|uniref:ABC transporter ATP-binding protein n=1 Tax=Micromonospora TaxID=1873 RepID=UPI0033E453F4
MASHEPRTAATNWSRYVAYVGGHRRWFLLLAALIPLDVGTQLVAPQVVRRFIDAAVGGRSQTELAGYAVVFVALAVVRQVLSTGTGWVSGRVAWRTTNEVRRDLLAHVLRQGPTFFLRHPPGELVDRMDGDVTRLAKLLSELVLDIAVQLLMIIGIVVALFLLDWRYGALFTPLALVMLLLLRRLLGRAVPLIADRQRAEAGLLGYLEENLTGREDLNANGGTTHALQTAWDRITHHYRLARRAARATVTWPAAVQVLTAVNLCAALATGVWLSQNRGVSVGTVFAGLSYAILLRMPLVSITSRFQDVQNVLGSVRRVEELFGEAHIVPDGGGTLAPGRGSVSFTGVTFAYEDRPVLSDVSFTIPAGRRVALVGRSGGGKSTILRMLFRQYDPQAGTVSVGGVDVRRLDVGALRSRITLVTQDVHVIAGTLRDNLTFYDDRWPDEQLLRSVEEVGLGTWYAALPDGLDTRIGPGAAGLSAGEEQLLALARALLTDPDIVLLDEPSARLDPHAERRLRRTMERFIEGRTALVIAHRPETLTIVDDVMVVEEGRVVSLTPRPDPTDGTDGPVDQRFFVGRS